MERFYMYRNLSKSEPLDRRRAAVAMMDSLFAFSSDRPPVFSVSLTLFLLSLHLTGSLYLFVPPLFPPFSPPDSSAYSQFLVPECQLAHAFGCLDPEISQLSLRVSGLLGPCVCIYFFLCLFIQAPKSNWLAQIIFYASHLNHRLISSVQNSALCVNHL